MGQAESGANGDGGKVRGQGGLRGNMWLERNVVTARPFRIQYVLTQRPNQPLFLSIKESSDEPSSSYKSLVHSNSILQSFRIKKKKPDRFIPGILRSKHYDEARLMV